MDSSQYCLVVALALVGLHDLVGGLASPYGERCCEGLGCFSNEPPYWPFDVPECLEDMPPKFLIYTREHPSLGYEMLWQSGSVIPFDPKKKSVFVVHGFTGGPWQEWVKNVTKGFLEKFDYNVIQVDWSEAASDLWYPQTAANIRTVAAIIARLAEHLVVEGGAEPSNMWCVGHSMGAQACGYVGKKVKLGRISGLDPAAPLFDLCAEEGCVLGREDADFVDVIHTNGQGSTLELDSGFMMPMGHVDFYPSGAKIQPGCDDEIEIGEAEQCSHNRAGYLFASSILSSCNFHSESTCTDWNNIPESCTLPCDENCPQMGLKADERRVEGLYFLDTKANFPYCLR